MHRFALPILPVLLLGTAPLALAADDDVHVISASSDSRVSVTAGDGYTDERTLSDDGARWQPCHHRRHRHHHGEDVQYGWDGVAYSDGCGGPAVRVEVAGPYLPPPRAFLPPPHVVAPLLSGAAHVGLVHGLAAVGMTALKIAAIPLILPFALHR